MRRLLLTRNLGPKYLLFLKSLEWMEITGMVADRDTVCVCTANNHDQKLLLSIMCH